MHVRLFYNTVSIKWVNVRYITLLNYQFFQIRKFEIIIKNEGMQRKAAEALTWASMWACQVHASVKEETPPTNLLVVDSNALLTRLQFYLGSWQLEAVGLYSRDSGIMNSAGPSISFWTLFPLISETMEFGTRIFIAILVSQVGARGFILLCSERVLRIFFFFFLH